jgi:hypothetical protein
MLQITMKREMNQMRGKNELLQEQFYQKKLSILSPESTVLQKGDKQSYIGVKKHYRDDDIPGNEVVTKVNLLS